MQSETCKIYLNCIIDMPYLKLEQLPASYDKNSSLRSSVTLCGQGFMNILLERFRILAEMSYQVGASYTLKYEQCIDVL